MARLRRTDHHHHHRPAWQVWMVALCFVFAALAPTLTHALARAQPTLPLEICTSAGAVSVSHSPTSQEDGGAMQVVHCPFCLQFTDRGAPAPHPLPYHFLVPGAFQVPMVWQAFFFASTSPWKPQVRGPPSV